MVGMKTPDSGRSDRGWKCPEVSSYKNVAMQTRTATAGFSASLFWMLRYYKLLNVEWIQKEVLDRSPEAETIYPDLFKVKSTCELHIVPTCRGNTTLVANVSPRQ